MTPAYINHIVASALKEDIGTRDITTDTFVPKNSVSQAFIVTHEDGTFVGFEIVKKIFQKLDKNVQVKCFFKDGDIVKAETRLIRIKGKTSALLTGERVALNFLSHLSTVATNTTAFIKEVSPYKVQIVDTRKTTPGLRLLEKYAVRAAKGTNHRMTLSDMVLIKDNHHLICPEFSITQMVEMARKTKKPICVEIEDMKDFPEVWNAQPEIIMLDNMSLKTIRQAISYGKKHKVKKPPMLEVSGGVNLDNIRSIIKTGIRRVSIGALTHTKKAINISMEIVPK